jgi:hypothetical protein
MIKDSTLTKLLVRVFLNPDLSFLIYFLIVGVFAWGGKSMMLLYGYILPWLILIILIINMPFFRLMFVGINMEKGTKINHVLEHGTIYYLKKRYGGNRKIGGRAKSSGFRVYGVKSQEDIRDAFEKLREYLKNGRRGIVLSKFCGSNVPILQGVSVLLLTATFIYFAFMKFDLIQIQIILLVNLVLNLLLKYPIGRYFQKRFTMSFDFSDARIEAINRSSKQGIFEKEPVYYVHTLVTQGKD